MAEAFGTVLIVTVIVAAIAAAIAYMGAGRVYQGIGKGAFSLDQPDRPVGPAPGSAAARQEQEAEVRQMLKAKSDRRVARGEAPIDIEAEVAALLHPSVTADEGLREEVRQLVVARNERRQRKGEEPLDVEPEVDRQLRELSDPGA